MTASTLFDLVKVSSATLGAGPIVLGPAVTGFLSPGTYNPPIPSGTIASYTIEDGAAPLRGVVSARETGQGPVTLLSGVWTLTRTTLTQSTTGAFLNCTGNQLVGLVVRAEDITGGGGSSPVVSIAGAFGANGSLPSQVPAGAMLVGARIQNTTGSDVMVQLGTTSGGAQILPALTVLANDYTPIPANSLLQLVWPAPQTVFVSSPSWGSANATVTLWYAT